MGVEGSTQLLPLFLESGCERCLGWRDVVLAVGGSKLSFSVVRSRSLLPGVYVAMLSLYLVVLVIVCRVCLALLALLLGV